MIEAIKISKADIYKYVADPAFVKVPTAGLLSKEFATARRALFDPTRAIAYPPAGSPDGSPTTSPRAPGPAFDDRYDGELHTTSFSIVDRFGNAVGTTPTLGGLFGNNVVVGSTGLLLNNGMRLGSTSPYPTDANYVGPGKIPILNNSPVVVLKDGKLAYVFGTPGGETIGQTEFQVLRQPARLPDAGAAGDRGAAPGARRRAELLQAGRRGHGADRGPRARRDHRGAEGHGPHGARAARLGQPRPHAGHRRRPADRGDDRRRRSRGAPATRWATDAADAT